jgi:hypothetical protein
MTSASALKSSPIERMAYPVVKAAEAVGRSRYVLYDAIRRKELPAYQQSEDSDYLILADDLRAWVTRYPAQPRRRKGGLTDADSSSAG